jgi:hypothetical protein
MTLNKKYENLNIYLICPMEDDDWADHELSKVENALIESGIPVENIANPCKQEKVKTGFDSMDSNKVIKKLRITGKDEEVDKIYQSIWEVDIENVRKADILIANIPPGTRYVGVTREATIATALLTFDLIKSKLPEEMQKEYSEKIRPSLKNIGFFMKPIYLITQAKTRINGTMIHGLVRPSGGEVFKSIGELIETLKEKYK